MKAAKRLLTLYRETYYHLNVRHFHVKLREEHEIQQLTPADTVSFAGLKSR